MADRATVEALAARHGVTPTRWLARGGVLRVNAGQLAALSRTPGSITSPGDIRSTRRWR